MATEPDSDDGDERALVVRVPVGLHVRAEEVNLGGGPFRSVARTRTVVDVDVVFPWMRLRALDLAIFTVLAAGMLWLTASGLWFLGIAIAGVVAIAALWPRSERRTARLFTLEDDCLTLGGGRVLSLAEVERVEVRSGMTDRVEVHEVVVETMAGELVVATLAAEEHARHVHGLIEDAVGACRRRLASG